MELINYRINQRLIVYKIKIRWNRTEKLIIDPTRLNKRLNVQSLNKKFGKHFQKSMILKTSKTENL